MIPNNNKCIKFILKLEKHKTYHMKNILYLLLFALCSSSGFAQQTPAKKQNKTIAIMGATAHLGNGKFIENSLIIFKDGKLTTVSPSSTMDLSGMEVIDAKGKHVYPGFIIPASSLGLAEIDAVKATVDDREIGEMNPHIRSIIAYNAESKVIESMRPNGVLIGQIAPLGGRLSGTSSVVQFDAWNWEDAIIKENDGIYLNWPNTFTYGRWWLGEDRGLKINDKYNEQVDAVASFFSETKAYAAGDKKTIHLPYAATAGLFDGSKKLYINVNDEKGIIDAVRFATDNKVKEMIIVGGSEAYKVTDILKENNIPVIIDRVHALPNQVEDDYDMPYKLANILVDKGIMVALNARGDMERMNSRNLPFYAGTTVAQGLEKEEALKLITSNPAKILGIDKDYGTLETGKSATLFISEGDALDMRSNQLTHAFIDGREVSLETHQTKLWHRYDDKYNSEE